MSDIETGRVKPKTMEERLATFEKMWSSDRLVYQAIDQNDDGEALRFMTELYKDPTIRPLSTFSAIKPVNKKSAQDFLSYATEQPLAVFICLPPDEKEKGQEKGELKEAGQGDGKPTIIGFLLLQSDKWEKGFMAGIGLKREYQNKGYGREALNWGVDWGFRWGGARRISIGTIAFNERAAHLYESIGFVHESRARSAVWSDGEWHDVLGLSMLQNEWKKLRGIE